LRLANEQAAELIVSRQMRWCRARLFQALAGAQQQGVLIPVIEELFSDSIYADNAMELASLAGGYVSDRWR
jgi:hypothetical protein